MKLSSLAMLTAFYLNCTLSSVKSGTIFLSKNSKFDMKMVLSASRTSIVVKNLRARS